MEKPTGQEWRPVVGWTGLYEVSSLGLVWSIRTKRTLKSSTAFAGYPQVGLSLNGHGSSRRIHQLVAEAFLGPCPEGQEIRHLDGNPANNAVSNLAYGTRGDNEQDKLRHGTHHNARKTHCKRGHEFTPENTRTTYGRRECLTCVRMHSRAACAKWRAKQRAQAA
jgi:hypothetical protein